MITFDHVYWAAVTAFLGLVSVTLVGCDDPPAESSSAPPPPVANSGPRIRKLYSNGRGEQNVWIDESTGCQYLAYENSIGTIRYTADGKPWCGIPVVTFLPGNTGPRPDLDNAKPMPLPSATPDAR
jgi:hypothetical protein